MKVKSAKIKGAGPIAGSIAAFALDTAFPKVVEAPKVPNKKFTKASTK